MIAWYPTDRQTDRQTKGTPKGSADAWRQSIKAFPHQTPMMLSPAGQRDWAAQTLWMIPSAPTPLRLPFRSGDGWMRRGWWWWVKGGQQTTALHCRGFIVLNCHGNWKQMYLEKESVQHSRSGPRCHPVNYTSLLRWRRCPLPCCLALCSALVPWGIL